MADASGLTFDERHAALMDVALTEAAKAAQAGEVPVGAVIVDSAGEIVARAHNACRAESSETGESDPTAHAEIVAIRLAAAASSRGSLEGCTLVVTLEPCAMCAGAILAARIPTVVFGAWDDKAGAAGSVFDLLRDRRLPHRCEVVAGVNEQQCRALLQQFFQDRR